MKFGDLPKGECVLGGQDLHWIRPCLCVLLNAFGWAGGVWLGLFTMLASFRLRLSTNAAYKGPRQSCGKYSFMFVLFARKFSFRFTLFLFSFLSSFFIIYSACHPTHREILA